MKKLLAVCICSLLVISGCQSKPQEPEKPSIEADQTKEAEIIIIGAGGAGLSAAIEAVNNGAKNVVLVEKTSKTGGSLNYTSGSMSGAETIIQEIDGVEDSIEYDAQDIMKNGGNLGNQELIDAFAKEDADTINWLWDNGLSDNTFSVDRATNQMSVFAPEHALYSQRRTYKVQPENKEVYKSAAHEILDTVLKAMPEIIVDYETNATQLLQNEKGQVLQVLATDKDGKTVLYKAEKGIIMATGGYSGNHELMGAFTKYGSSYLAGGSSAADGYGIYMMQEIGANVDPEKMGWVPTFPMGLAVNDTTGIIAPTYMWKAGAISINKDGNRFVNETEETVEIREMALEEQPEAIMYDVFTDNVILSTVEKNSSVFWSMYYSEGKPYHDRVVKANSIEELAELIGVNAENLKTTIDKYNANVESQTTDEFGRQFTEDSLNTYNVAVNKIEGDVYSAIPQKALCVMTMGGVDVNTNNQVLDTKGNAIPGLFATGEVVGGVWGKFVSSGTGVMGPIVFGRLAARSVLNTELSEGYTLEASNNTIDAKVFEKKQVESTSRFDMNTPLNDGEYTAKVSGQEGEMTVKTTITDGKIAGVEIVEQHETESIAASALESIPGTIVSNNSPDVDIVASATLTSNRIMDAVALCLQEASK